MTFDPISKMDKNHPIIILLRVIRRKQQSRSLDAYPKERICSMHVLKACIPKRTSSLDVFTKNDTSNYVASANMYVTKGTCPANTHRIMWVLLCVTLETFYDDVIMI